MNHIARLSSIWARTLAGNVQNSCPVHFFIWRIIGRSYLKVCHKLDPKSYGKPSCYCAFEAFITIAGRSKYKKDNWDSSNSCPLYQRTSAEGLLSIVRVNMTFSLSFTKVLFIFAAVAMIKK